MRLTVGDYDCTVAPPGGAGSEIASLFEPEAGRARAERQRASTSAPANPDQRARILDLLDGKYRDLLRKQCGPPPELSGKTD